MELDRVLFRCLLAASLGLLPHWALAAADAQSVLQQAEKAMGGSELKAIRYAGTATGVSFGQAYLPGQAWPKLNYSGFSRLADYGNAALRDESARSRAEPKGGGAVPLLGMGEQRSTTFLHGNDAWNMVGPVPVPALVAVNERIHELWTTPHGVLKAALRNQATLVSHSPGGASVIRFTEPGRFSATVRLNAAGLVEQIDSRLPHPVLGDMSIKTTFARYQEVDGIKFPMHIQQSQDGQSLFDLTVREVHANPATAIELPAMVRGASDRVASEEVATGVWFLTGGSHNSVAIEMKDSVILVESPLYDGRASAVLAEVRKLVSGKEIGQVINSHHHFDHAGGLRTAVAEGATLITSEAARPYFERVFANPNRIRPDALAQSGKKARIIGIKGKGEFSDGQRRVEIYPIEASVHASGFLMVYLPNEKLLIEADAFTPGPPNAAPPATPNDNHVTLVNNIERLKLDVARILPLHGRMVPIADLYTAIGKKP
jgi:glyoxylase-like metal-dependent hydrolase (beta-lactamase superfamily II)